MIEVGRIEAKNSFSSSAGEAPADAQAVEPLGDPFRHGSRREHGVYGDARSSRRFGEAAGDGQLCRLRHSVMDHLRRNLQPGLA